MSNATFNAGIDYFALETATTNALKVTSSNENRSKQSTSGANCYGDAAVVDSWGETAAPSSDYLVVAEVAHTLAAPKITLGDLIAAASSNISIGGTGAPVVIGSLSINTQTGSAPTVSVSGQAVQTGATALRTYTVSAFTLSPRHRAHDFLGLCTIKKGSGTLTAADAGADYGLESVNAQFPIEFTLAQPKGELKAYDLHGGMATVDFTMNWYGSGEPTIVTAETVTLRTSSAESNNTSTVYTTVSNPVAKACPEGGYTQYTWQVSFPLIGYEVPQS
jgi:hypothetical protein